MRLIYKYIIFYTGCCLLGLVGAANAGPEDVLGAIPSVSDAGLTQKRLSAEPTPKFGNGKSTIQGFEKPAMPSGADKIHFTFNKVIFEGNTVFSSEELETIFKSSEHKNISLTDLQNMVDAVTAKYRNAGYILSRAILPPQTIKGGVVKVQVIEGFISHIIIKGDISWVKSEVNGYSEEILKSKPLNIKVLENSLLLSNDLPGMTVKAVLTPSPNVPAGADLTLVATEQRYNGYLSYDNFGTRYLGPKELGAGITGNSLTFPGSSDSFRFMTVTQTDEMQYYQLLHTNPIGNSGGKFTFDAEYTDTLPGFTLSQLNVRGRSQLFYVDLSYPMVRSRQENFNIHSSFNYQNVMSTILGEPFYNDLLRSLIIGGQYTLLDQYRGFNTVQINLKHGFTIMGAVMHVNQSRPLAVPDYTHINLDLSRLQALWSNFTLFMAIQGQYAFNPLLATEQYAYGGAYWGRGYDPSEIVGDSGLAGKLELRIDTAPARVWLQSVQYYVFYDLGEIWNRDGVDLQARQSAISTGFGARFVFIPNLTANLFVAQPLTHSISAQVLMNKNPRIPRGFFQLVATF